MSLFSIRPAPGAQANPFAVYLAPQTLITYGLKTGDVVSLETSDGNRREVQLVRSADKNMNPSVIQMSARVQKLYSLGTQQKVKLIPKQIEVPRCQSIVLYEIHDGTNNGTDSGGSLEGEWLNTLRRELQILELISVGIEIADIGGPGGIRRSFKVAQIDNDTALKVSRVALDCDLKVLSLDDLRRPLHLDESVYDICGLDNTIRKIQNRVSWFGGSNDGSRRWQGILLHGPAGTGKSMLIDHVLKADWLAKVELDSSFTKTMLDQTVEGVLKSQPAVIAIHNLDEIAARDSGGNLSRGLRKAFRRIADAQVLVIAACRALAEIDQDLRNVECFGFQFEIPTPNTATRAEILKVNQGAPRREPNLLLDRVSTLTHGFVGRDLVHLLQQAKAIAERRIQLDKGQDTHAHLSDATFHIELNEDDFLKALKLVRPSALREVVIETPDVRWEDVAGQDDAKQLLEKAITWPLKYPHILRKHNFQAAKGMLLYGPPGCSKTMMARAVAAESKLNFISVKAAELLNMYVGESERAIRDIFAKAAAASPCILFFDEFEAIATSRLNSSGSANSVHTVTTLLTEMDGFATRRDIFVLCATNFPEQIDPAIIRPGRIDDLLYIGPPDLAARLQIIKRRCSEMQTGDVNMDEIGSATDGMSGAEVVELCRSACRLLIEEEIATGVDSFLDTAHFTRALEGVRKNITAEMLQRYELFAGGKVRIKR